MRCQMWTRRALLLLALTAPYSLFVLMSPPPEPSSSRHSFPPVPETDLRRVYDTIPDRIMYDELGRWCGLRQTPATPAEVAAIREALRAAPDPKQVWCTGEADMWMRVFPDGVRPPERAKWVRLHHPTRPDQWIGIGILEQENTGWTAYYIVCRVAIGF
jgi:hypothetical protein